MLHQQLLLTQLMSL